MATIRHIELWHLRFYNAKFLEPSKIYSIIRLKFLGFPSNKVKFWALLSIDLNLLLKKGLTHYIA